MLNLFYSQKMTKFLVPLSLATVIAVFAGCTGTTISSTTKAPSTVVGIQISATPTTIKTDNSNISTLTVTAVDANNATKSNASITLSADTGLLSTQTVITGANGTATATFSSGTASKANRTATITATAGGATALLPVQIVGTTLTWSQQVATVATTGPGTTTSLTLTVLDAGKLAIAGVAVTLTQAGSGTVTLTPVPVAGTATGTTDVNGKLTVTVAGLTAGSATVTAAAVGATTASTITVTGAGSTFGISQLTLTPPGSAAVVSVPSSPKTAAMRIGDTLDVQVTVPTGTPIVTFATTIGTWVGAVTPPTVIQVAPAACTVAGVPATCATATLTTAATGLANVQVYASPTLSDTLTVGMTATTPAKISLQASPSIIPKSVGTTVGYSNLSALVLDINNNPVGGVPVAFSIVGGNTGSGEVISPVVVFTAITTTGGLALGAAPSTFTSGSLSSGAAGEQIRASVVGTTIATQPLYNVNGTPASNATSSSFDAAIVVGGSAGSVAFGQATFVIDAGAISTIYQYPMSVLVSDSNGSPAPLGTVVNLSVWPIAWTTGFKCYYDDDGGYWDASTTPVWHAAYRGTFLNEDANQNLILDAGEDGKRLFYASGTNSILTPANGATSPAVAGTTFTVPTGTIDGKITPVNSYGGSIASTNSKDLPGTATTDANGVATFNLTYTKSSAMWVVSRIRAQTFVQGSSAVGQIDFRLRPSKADVVPCTLPDSPFNF